MADIYVATTSGVVLVDGVRCKLRKGVTLARAGHPLYETNQSSFKPLHVHYDVPGEEADDPTPAKSADEPKRSGGRPRRRDTTETPEATAGTGGTEVRD